MRKLILSLAVFLLLATPAFASTDVLVTVDINDTSTLVFTMADFTFTPLAADFTNTYMIKNNNGNVTGACNYLWELNASRTAWTNAQTFGLYFGDTDGTVGHAGWVKLVNAATEYDVLDAKAAGSGYDIDIDSKLDGFSWASPGADCSCTVTFTLEADD